MTALTTEDLDPSIKIAVIGNGSIGKSSLIRRFCRNEYVENYKKTIGVEYAEREVEVPGEGDVRVMVWDTAGQEEFIKMTQEYYKDADAIILAFSTTDRTSFDTLLKWRAKVQEVCDDIPMVLVQNKIDLVHEGVVGQGEAEALARDMRIRFYRVSVKEGINVDEVFIYLSQLHFQRSRARRQAHAEQTATSTSTHATSPPPRPVSTSIPPSLSPPSTRPRSQPSSLSRPPKPANPNPVPMPLPALPTDDRASESRRQSSGAGRQSTNEGYGKVEGGGGRERPQSAAKKIVAGIKKKLTK